MFDTHVHTMFSGDSQSNPFEIINYAKSIGLSGITFTDHHDMDIYENSTAFTLDIPDYLRRIKEISDKVSDKNFKLYLGIEFGMQSHLSTTLHEILAQNEMDFCIGSVHYIDKGDPYYDEFFDGHSVQERYHEFMVCTLENVIKFDEINTLGHLDYITRYGKAYAVKNNLPLPDITKEYDIVREILSTLIKKDIALEVNTGSFRSNKTDPNPSYEILKIYYDMGGRLLTLGSDAHTPDYVGKKFDEVSKKLKDIGFKSGCVFEKRIPREYPL